MKSLIPLLMIAALSSCASVGSLSKNLPALDGQPVEEAILAFGSAYYTQNNPAGTTYKWSRRNNGATGKMLVPGAAATYLKTISIPTTECTLSIDTDTAGRIVRSSYEGDDQACWSFDMGIRKYLRSRA